MLLDEKQIALNELLVAYRESADHYADANEYLDDVDLASLFDTIGEGHTEAADAVSDVIRKTGTLPRAQHADREQFHQIVTHIRAALSEDDGQVFLRDRIEQEREIARLIAECLKVRLPLDTRAHLEVLQTRERDVLAMLNQALESRIP